MAKKKVGNAIKAKKKVAKKRTKKRTAKDGALVAKARPGLNRLWAEADLKGRCWGPRGKSPFGGTTALIGIGNVIVVVFQENGTGQLCTQTWVPALGSPLENKIRDIIRRRRLPLRGPQ